ncbi:MAG: glycyl-radical enzyme activating protein [Candidatus Zixiibacteriota bacterium]
MATKPEIGGKIFDIKRYAIHDGPGIRTTVFLSGCPLDCLWCHNPEARNLDTTDPTGKTRTVTVSEVMEEVTKDRVFYDQSGGGVTFSGGEPLFQIDFLEALCGASRRLGIRTAVDTCGHAPWADFERIYNDVDLFLYDLKLMDDNEHRHYTGESNRQILENLKLLTGKGSAVNIRIPLVPGITDTEANLDRIRDLVASLPGIARISLLPYNQFGEDKRRRFGLPGKLGNLEQQSKVDVESKADRFRSLGCEVKIGG